MHLYPLGPWNCSGRICSIADITPSSPTSKVIKQGKWLAVVYMYVCLIMKDIISQKRRHTCRSYYHNNTESSYNSKIN